MFLSRPVQSVAPPPPGVRSWKEPVDLIFGVPAAGLDAIFNYTGNNTLTGTDNTSLEFFNMIMGEDPIAVGWRMAVMAVDEITHAYVSDARNGVYEIVDLGANDPGGHPCVLVRTSDFSGSALKPGNAFIARWKILLFESGDPVVVAGAIPMAFAFGAIGDPLTFAGFSEASSDYVPTVPQHDVAVAFTADDTLTIRWDDRPHISFWRSTLGLGDGLVSKDFITDHAGGETFVGLLLKTPASGVMGIGFTSTDATSLIGGVVYETSSHSMTIGQSADHTLRLTVAANRIENLIDYTGGRWSLLWDHVDREVLLDVSYDDKRFDFHSHDIVGIPDPYDDTSPVNKHWVTNETGYGPPVRLVWDAPPADDSITPPAEGDPWILTLDTVVDLTIDGIDGVTDLTFGPNGDVVFVKYFESFRTGVYRLHRNGNGVDTAPQLYQLGEYGGYENGTASAALFRGKRFRVIDGAVYQGTEWVLQDPTGELIVQSSLQHWSQPPVNITRLQGAGATGLSLLATETLGDARTALGINNQDTTHYWSGTITATGGLLEIFYGGGSGGGTTPMQWRRLVPTGIGALRIRLLANTLDSSVSFAIKKNGTIEYEYGGTMGLTGIVGASDDLVEFDPDDEFELCARTSAGTGAASWSLTWVERVL